MPKPTTPDNPEAVLIDCTPGGWWRPLGNGYTYSVLEAGVFEPFKPWRPDDKLVPLKQAIVGVDCPDAALEYIRARSLRDLDRWKAQQGTLKDG